jgi:pimeloyl-ACP methyl ester carboxylesterase
MSTFVLVHGAWHGGWCYRDTAKALRAAGHTVYTPSLPGAAEHSHANHHGMTLETHVRDILGLFASEDLEEVILVGHSYGGMVVSSVADRIPEKIKHLVLLDAMVPENGDSLMSILDKSLPPEAGAAYRAFFLGAAATDHGMMMAPIPGAMFGMPEKESAWMERQCRPQALATFTSPAFMSGKGDKVPRTYILAKDWQPSPFPYFADRARKAGWNVEEMAGGHCLMLQHPEELTRLLGKAAV